MSDQNPWPANPTGWYGVLDSDELAAGDLVPLHYFGRELVAARGEDGTAQVFDAYCPHLGAHLGHGGRVDGNRIVCPFHAWEFDVASGGCANVPYAKRIPRNAKLSAYRTQEVNGLVLVWFDEKGRDPSWQVEAMPEVGAEGWIQVGRLEWRIKTHLHEVLENVVDTAHIRYVHGSESVPTMGEASYEPGVMRFDLDNMGDGAGLRVNLYGLGVARLFYNIEVDLFELDTQTPINEHEMLARSRIYIRDLGSAEANQAVAGEVLKELGAQVDADIEIFEHKRHVAQPLLCDGDGPIHTFRAWAEQFYDV